EGLYAKFSDNLRADAQGNIVILKSERKLAGLPQAIRNTLAENAKKKNLAGKWVVTNTRSSVDQFLTHSTNRALREKVWKMFADRGERSNKEVVAEILKLRQERAQLLGYPTHTHWRIESFMAKTPENALQFLKSAWEPVLAAYKREVEAMQVYARAEGHKSS